MKAAGPGSIVEDWTEKNSSFFEALQVERTAMRLILMVVVAVVALNIISGLVMLVKNKSRDIAILRTIGATRGSILRIFFMAGASIGALGTGAGLLLGILFCVFIQPIQRFVEFVTGAHVFNADVYFLSHLPAKVDPVEVLVIVAFSLGMSFFWSVLPAWWASRLDPVEALRFE
jgi:lipoprotein-releasing system permease protein